MKKPEVTIGFDTIDIRDMIATRSPDGKKLFMNYDGKELLTTDRFWNSFSSKFRLGDSTFNYFSYEEVFERIAKTSPKEAIVRICTEGTDSGSKLLAITSPSKPVVSIEGMGVMAKKYQGTSNKYHEGHMSVSFAPKRGKKVLLGHDEFQRRFVVEAPVDGYGKPRIYLELLRLICQNGAIAMSPAFRTDLNVGDDPFLVIERALQSFDNEEGYIALQQRFESAQTSTASLRESSSLHKLLLKYSDRDVVKAYEKVSGNVGDVYGLASTNALSEKKQRILPAKCRVYDLLNFASEVATHKVAPVVASKFQAYIGDLITREYDMEGVAPKTMKFQDRFLKD